MSKSRGRVRIGAIGILVALALAIYAIVARTPSQASGPSTWGDILIAGGVLSDDSETTTTELFDETTDTFAATTPQMAVARSGQVQNLIIAGPNAGQVLIASGNEDTATEIYDPAGNSFGPGPELGVHHGEKSPGVTVTFGPALGRIFISGLCGSCSGDLYDPLLNEFIYTSGPITEVSAFSGTLISTGPDAGMILLAGGSDGDGHALSATSVFDPVLNSMISGPTLDEVREFHTATAITTGPNTGKILLAGGDNFTVDLATTDIYDPTNNSFSTGASMNVAREGMTATVIPSGTNAGKILFAGGESGSTFLSSTELYDPTAGTFAAPANTASMGTARAYHAAVVISSGPEAGKILIAGGETTGFTVLATTQFYDPDANTLSPGPDMNLARTDPVALELPSSPLPTPTATETLSPTATDTATATATDTATPTASASPTQTTTATPTFTQTRTSTPTPTLTSTPTATRTSTTSSTVTATRTATPSPTSTTTATPTTTTTATQTASPTPTAVPVKLKITPKQLNFGNVAVNNASKPKNVKISNPKGSKKHPGIEVLIEGAEAAAQFHVTNGCPSPLDAGAKCSISVVFAPTAAATVSATLVIFDNATGAPQSVKLKGVGK